MPKKGLSRGRGPRVTEEQLDRMVALYLEGKTFKSIAQAVGRHWQTVRKYTVKAVREREGEQLRREALKEAVLEHFHDLADALSAVSGLVDLPDSDTRASPGGWQPQAPARREKLLLDALRESHAKDSPLWPTWDKWNEARRVYDRELSCLSETLDRELRRLGKLFPRTSLTEFLGDMLFRRAASIAMGGSLYDPSLLVVRPASDQGGRTAIGELWLGTSTHLASGPDMDGLRRELSGLMAGMKEWDEIKELAKQHKQMAELKGEIEEEAEVLSLRRAFPGHCRLCPV